MRQHMAGTGLHGLNSKVKGLAVGSANNRDAGLEGLN